MKLRAPLKTGKYLLIMFSCLNMVIGMSQDDSTGYKKYTAEFDFRDGIFLDFKQVKQNDPVPKSRILTSVDFNSNAFFDDMKKQKSVLFYDELGVKREVSINNIWGYAQNGVLYKNMQNEFFRVTIVGGISHFVATHTSYQNQYANPHYHPYYGRSARYSVNANPVSETRQYILDFSNGEVLDYNYKNVEMLLMKDTTLYGEYNKLRRKKKKQQKFLFIRKYNERNPLYFPSQENKNQIP